MRQIAFHNIRDDDFLAIGEKLGSEMPADEPVAAENDVSHWIMDLCG